MRLGASERDVGEAQLVVGLLGLVLAHVRGPVGAAGPADVAHPVVAVVVEDRGRWVAAGEVVPGERHQHDRELQPLAGVHGDDLHRGRVGLQPPAALLSALAGRLRPAPPQPDQQRGQPELPLQRCLMHDLRDVPQVGEQPLAADLAEDPRLQPLVERHRFEHRGHAPVLEHGAPNS